MEESRITVHVIQDNKRLGKVSVFSKIALCLLFFLLSWSVGYGQVTPTGGVVYVSPAGTGNGSSWANASEIMNAITNAPNNTELRLREGTYAITMTLFVTQRLTINGGYTGVGATRNIVDSPTILDGGGTTQIMLIDRDNVVIDGLEFRRGFVTGSLGGGAIYMTGRTITISNSRFLNNISSGERGAGAIYIGSPARGAIITDCIFENNRNIFIDYPMGQNGGGAIHNWAPNVAIDNTVFRNNIAENSGGAVYNWGENFQVTECNFIENHSDDGGGAIHVNYYDVHVTGGSFINNTATLNGGAINNRRSLFVNGVVFRNNRSGANGAAIFNSNHLAAIRTTQFIQNEAEGQGGAIYNNFGALNVALSEFTNNKGLEKGGAIGNNFGQITISQATFETNNTDGEGGAIYNHRFAEPSVVERSEFRGNTSAFGGGLYNFSDKGLQVVSSLFVENEATDMGGAIFNNRFIQITNSTFVRNTNTALIIPSITETDSNPAITHIYNSIFYLNTARAGGYRADIHSERLDIDLSTQNIRRNITQEYTGTENLIGVNPLFRNFVNGDFSLQDNSPAVEYGRNNLYTEVKGNAPATDSDLVGNPRLFNTYVDAGAYELQLNSTLTPPSCTTLSSPVNGATDIAITSTIEWNAVDDAHGYHIFIGTAPGVTNIANGLNVGNVTTYTPVTALDENTTYYVTIVPYNTAGTATGCTEESFTTENLPTVPDCATITSPTDGATGVPVDADITWDAVSGADGYRIFMSMTAGNTDIIDVGITTGTSYNSPVDFDENTTYYVRIVPFNSDGEAVGCEEISFTTVTRPEPPQAADQQFCPPATVSDLTAEGTYIRWYDQETGGSPLSTTTALSSGTYYATQTVDDLESDRRAITVTVEPVVAPQFVGDIRGCGSLTVADLENVGVGLQWYNQAIGGTVLSPTTTLSTGTYYASRVSGTCESDRTAVDIIISVTPVPDVPDQSFVPGSTYADLDIVGQNLRWYTEPTGGTPFDPQTVISNGTYYVSQTIDDCESDRVIVQINITSVPDCVTNITPADGATDVPVDTNISWGAVAGATGYRIFIGTIPGGTDIANNIDVGNAITYTPPTDFDENTVHYVTVVPYNAAGNAAACTEFRFTTETLPTAPDCTTITAPVNNAIGVALLPTITWDAVVNTIGYRLIISTIPNGSDVLDMDVGNVTSYTLTSNLAENTIYYVRAVPYNGTGEASACAVIQFRTRLMDIPPVTFPDGTFEYDGTVHQLAIVETLPADLQVSYSSNNGLLDVGQETVTVTISGEGYNTLILTARLRVVPKTIQVTATSQTKEYGDMDPILTYSLTPELVGDDHITGGLDREAGESVGLFAITQGTLTLSDNYELNFVEGTLSILPAPLLISARDTVKMHDDIPFYGGTPLVFSGFKFSDNENNLAGSPVFTGDSQGAVTVGQYSISLSGYETINYTITYISGTLHILPRTFFVPNVITPNGDGKNEAFYVKSMNFLNWVNIRIYNRAGQLLYSEEDYQDDFRGENLLDGTYFYEIEYKETSTSKTKKHKGYLTIIRHIDSSYY